MLELQQNLGPGTVTTAYTYDIANELVTAQVDGTTWNYTYDANGSLTEVLPNGNPGSGAKRYTYNAAGNLVQVEAHNGSSWDVQAGMDYNGLGQRLSMTAAGVTSTYVMDGDRPLTAESGGNTTFFLYGRGAIGEKTTEWNFSLPDGTNTPRQLSDSSGDITLSVRYTPWGDAMETEGTGNFTFGYLGGILDATTGLIYVGEGQYYDPATGRFLTRGVNPDAPNPYVPWNPIGGAIIGPLALFSLVARRKKGKTNPYLLMFFMLVVLPLSVGMACNIWGDTSSSAPPTPATSITPIALPPATVTSTATLVAQAPASSTDSCTDCDDPEPTSTPTPTPTPVPSYNRTSAASWATNNLGAVHVPDYLGSDCTNFVSQALHYGGELPVDNIWKPWTSNVECDSVEQGCPWIRTSDLYSYLTKNMGFVALAQFGALANTVNDPQNVYDYNLLREHPGWADFVANAQPGDLVFYHDTLSYDSWSHVSIVIEGSGHTNDVLKVDNTYMQEPFIAEHDGPLPQGDGIRTMGDTDNQYIGFVAILHKP